MLKKGARILVIEDSPFKRNDKSVFILGIIARNDIVEGAISFYVGKDGDDAAEMIIRSVRKSRFSDQIKLVVTNGIAIAGLNIVDMTEIKRRLRIGAIAITRKKPRPMLLRRAIRVMTKDREKLALFNRLSKEISIYKSKGYYLQTLGIEKGDAGRLVSDAVKYLRLAHLIAGAVVRGESKGRI
ncbi:MAG: DUF99 family protein [Candidatus Micrarchaeota archaeon]|nr:DUF99 family protein [Candidatus Micrarchaeota archaeon]MDE1823892.1 DUF99 family protein [Candidatus Micrarchaeota archaeon]MDE1849306.1 DUF99 family protein [Candidatus Micrarchaeota archaeon]